MRIYALQLKVAHRVNELLGIQKSFENVLAYSLWTMDFRTIHSTMIGMNAITIVDGVKIENYSMKTFYSLGRIIDEQGNHVIINEKGESIFPKNNTTFFSDLLSHQFNGSVIF